MIGYQSDSCRTWSVPQANKEPQSNFTQPHTEISSVRTSAQPSSIQPWTKVALFLSIMTKHGYFQVSMLTLIFFKALCFSLSESTQSWPEHDKK